MNKKGFVKALIAVAVAAAVGSYLSLSPSISLPNGWDKLAHLIFYAASTFALYFFIGEYSLAVSSIMASVLEYLQRFVPARQSSIIDLLYSLTGVLGGFFLAHLSRRREENP